MGSKSGYIPLPEKKVQRNIEIPLLGAVAAGEPIEAIEIPESFAIPPLFAGTGETYALKVKGESMKEDGILEYLEFGSKVLGGFVKKIDKEAIVTSFE